MPPITTGQALKLLKTRHGVNNVCITGFQVGADDHRLTVGIPSEPKEHWPEAIPFGVVVEKLKPSQPAKWLRSPATGREYTLHLLTVQMALKNLGIAVDEVEVPSGVTVDDVIKAYESAVMVNPRTPDPAFRRRSKEWTDQAQRAQVFSGITNVYKAGLRVGEYTHCESCGAIECKHGLCWACGRTEDCAECAHADEGKKQ